MTLPSLQKLSPLQIAQARARAKRVSQLHGARHRCELFVEYAFRHEANGQRLVNAPFHGEWHDLARANDKLVIFAPVEHAKTQHLGIALPLHRLGQNPNLRIALISNTADMAEKNLRAIRQHIEQNAQVHEVFPALRPSSDPALPWHTSAITVERPTIARDPSIQACGVYGNIVGSRLDLIVLDDVLDFDNTRTEEQRKKLVEWFESTVFTRLTEGGRILVIGTPWHQEDLMHVLAARPGFKVATYSAVDNPDDPPPRWRPVWLSQWPLARLLDRYENTTENVFLRKYLCRVRTDVTGRFKALWIEVMVRLGRGKTFTSLPPKAQGGEKFLPCYTSVDLGVGLGRENAQTVLTTLAVDERGRRQIVNIEAGRWTAPEILERCHRAHIAYGSTIYVENNGAQQFLVQIAQGQFPVIGVTTGANKHHEEFGVEGLAVQVRNGWLVMPSGAGGTMESVPAEGRALISEMLHYTPEAHTGDRLMSLWIGSEAIRRFSAGITTQADLQAR